LNASDILLARLPDAQIWFTRVGHRAVHRIGYAGSMIWDGQIPSIEVNACESGTLVGMSLLDGWKLEIEGKVGGDVRITAME
jgi:hypothetical protein